MFVYHRHIIVGHSLMLSWCSSNTWRCCSLFNHYLYTLLRCQPSNCYFLWAKSVRFNTAAEGVLRRPTRYWVLRIVKTRSESEYLTLFEFLRLVFPIFSIIENFDQPIKQIRVPRRSSAFKWQYKEHMSAWHSASFCLFLGSSPLQFHRPAPLRRTLIRGGTVLSILLQEYA